MGSTRPVGTHFGKALCNQHLKQPSDTVNLSGIPQGFFSVLQQQLKHRLRQKVDMSHGGRAHHLSTLSAVNEMLHVSQLHLS